MKQLTKEINMLTSSSITELGFTVVPHFTVMNSYNYSLGRRQFLRIGGLGTPNEVLYLCEQESDALIYSDLICLHNYDYDGYLTVADLEQYITTLAH